MSRPRPESIVGRSRWALVVLLLLQVLPFAGRPALIGGDEPHYCLVAMSLALDGDLRLQEDYLLVEREGSVRAGKKRAGKSLDRHLTEGSGVSHFSHPLGMPLLLAPLLWVQQRIFPGSAPDLLIGLVGLSVTFAGLCAGRDLLLRIVEDQRQADYLAFVFYFTTPLWFTSRTFFTEPYIWALTVVALWWMSRECWLTASFFLGLLFLIKEPTALIIAPLVLTVLLTRGVVRGLKIAVFPAVAVGLFVAKNIALYGEPFVTFQTFRVGDLAHGAWGVLVDPAHGLVVFAPVVFVLTVWRPVLQRSVSRTAWVVAVAWFLMTAAWIDWTGGSCFGPRLMVPMLPASAILIVEAWLRWRDRESFRKIFAVLAWVGFVIQWSAVVDPFGAFWSIRIDDLLTEDPLMTLVGAVIGWLLLRKLSGQPRGAPKVSTRPASS